MPRNKTKRRKIPVLVLVILAAAIVGLGLININPTNAQQSLQSAKQQGGHSALANPTDQSVPSLIWPVIKMFSALTVVIVAVYLAMYGLKKLNNRRTAGSAAPGSLELMQSVYVGPHKTVSLVRVGKKSVLVGVTDHGISKLTELSPDETEGLLVAENESSHPANTLRFAGVLEAARDKFRNAAARKRDTATQSC